MKIILVLGVLFLVQCTSSSSSSVSLASCNSGERPMVVNNQGSEDIWLGMVSSSQTCTTDADCAPGTCSGPANNGKHYSGATCVCSASGQCNSAATCNITTSPDHLCFLNLPRIVNPSQSQTKQAFIPTGLSLALCFPSAGNLQVQWSGRLFARKGCDANGQNCQSANCTTNTQNGNCLVGTGGNPPATSAEFTFQNRALSATNTDFYDVTMIDGVNMAVSIQPDPNTAVLDPNLPYQCTSPGATQQTGFLKPCNWKINVPSANITLFRQSSLPVGVAPTLCSSDSDCSNGQVCGLALNAKVGQKFANACGPLQGYWSASQICDNLPFPQGTDNSPVSALGCYGAPGGQPMTDLLKCTGTAAASCYRTGGTPDSTCCGCPTAAGNNSGWPSLDLAQSSIQCLINNQNWVTAVQPWLQPFKQACPTAYTFPFDDPTSTFTCLSAGDPNTTPGYTVTFSDLN